MFGIPPSGGPDRLKPAEAGTPNGRFLESAVFHFDLLTDPDSLGSSLDCSRNGLVWCLRIMSFVRSQNDATIFFSQDAVGWQNSIPREQAHRDQPLLDDGSLDPALLRFPYPGPGR